MHRLILDIDDTSCDTDSRVEEIVAQFEEQLCFVPADRQIKIRSGLLRAAAEDMRGIVHTVFVDPAGSVDTLEELTDEALEALRAAVADEIAFRIEYAAELYPADEDI